MTPKRAECAGLLDVHNFVAPGGVRVMEMEWIDGYDLQRLLTPAMLRRARERVDDERWAYLNDVIVTAGAAQPRLKPGVAIAVLRDCLEGAADRQIVPPPVHRACPSW